MVVPKFVNDYLLNCYNCFGDFAVYKSFLILDFFLSVWELDIG
jgi:hypothetical protein